MNILIIGAGAAGMMAALAAAQNPTCQVYLLERQSRVGKKLSATGNGRCNLTNTHATPSHYYGADPSFTVPALTAMSQPATLDFFEALGLATVTEPSGKVYPFSDQASSVVDVLRFALGQPNIHLELDCEVTKIWKKSDGFLLKTTKGDFSGEKLILATGGMASPKLGGTDLGYTLAKSLKHKTTALAPSLVQITCQNSQPSLKGIRTQAALAVTKGRQTLATTQGEVQFTDQGLSGPAIFEVSRAVSTAAPVTVTLDFLPQWSDAEAYRHLTTKCNSNPSLPAQYLWTGVLHNRLGALLVKQAAISQDAPQENLTDHQLTQAIALAKSYPFHADGTQGFDHCQVTVGGLETKDFHPTTLESTILPNFFACGEVLDIDGDCGGYNLQWAWSSGYLAGKSATEGVTND